MLSLIILLSIFWGEGLGVWESGQGLSHGPLHGSRESVIIWWVRLPRLITALVAGATLSLTGAVMQSLLRNDLADPYLLGVAAGGGLGGALSLSLGVVSTLGLWSLPFSSFCGALLSCYWVDRLAQASKDQLMTQGESRWILSGVALNLFLSALLTLTLSLSGEQLGGLWRWIIGHTQGLSWYEVMLMSTGALIGGCTLLIKQREILLLEAGHEVAWTLGISVQKIRMITLVSIALSVGAVVAYCGVIGFIGLLVPHFLRPYLIGSSRHLFSLSALYGACLLTLCDLLAKMSPHPLPVGVVTGVLGGAAFLYSQHQEHLE